MWDKKVENFEVFVGKYIVAYSFRNIRDQFSWISPGVYGLNTA
jgi:hypothetical protein